MMIYATHIFKDNLCTQRPTFLSKKFVRGWFDVVWRQVDASTDKSTDKKCPWIAFFFFHFSTDIDHCP